MAPILQKCFGPDVIIFFLDVSMNNKQGRDNMKREKREWIKIIFTWNQESNISSIYTPEEFFEFHYDNLCDKK